MRWLVLSVALYYALSAVRVSPWAVFVGVFALALVAYLAAAVLAFAVERDNQPAED